MRVMQFAFGPDTVTPLYDPSTYPENSVGYTGTHDNDTVVGLFRSEAGDDSTRTAEVIEAERRTILTYTQTDGSEIHWDFIEHVWKSQSQLAICPLQDVMGLGSEARMNIPGKSGEFWNWRFTWDQLTSALEARLREVTARHGRV
nr:4-alpha-glucanotransferase [Verrucomicrobium spinosum]